MIFSARVKARWEYRGTNIFRKNPETPAKPQISSAQTQVLSEQPDLVEQIAEHLSIPERGRAAGTNTLFAAVGNDSAQWQAAALSRNPTAVLLTLPRILRMARETSCVTAFPLVRNSPTTSALYWAATLVFFVVS